MECRNARKESLSTGPVEFTSDIGPGAFENPKDSRVGTSRPGAELHVQPLGYQMKSAPRTGAVCIATSVKNSLHQEPTQGAAAVWDVTVPRLYRFPATRVRLRVTTRLQQRSNQDAAESIHRKTNCASTFSVRIREIVDLGRIALFLGLRPCLSKA